MTSFILSTSFRIIVAGTWSLLYQGPILPVYWHGLTGIRAWISNIIFIVFYGLQLSVYDLTSINETAVELKDMDE